MRSKKELYNITTQMTYEIVAMVCGLILPRFILAAFGSGYNGMVSSITQFLDYISILTLGVAGSTRVAIYKANVNGDIRAVSAVVKSTERYMRKVAAAFIAYLLILIFVYPYFVRNEFTWAQSASLVVIIGMGTFAEYLFGVTYRIYLTATQNVYVYNIVHIFTKIANTLVCVALIKYGCSIQIVKLGGAVCFVISPIVLHAVVRRKFRLITDIEPDDSALNQRKDVMAHSIANTIHQYTDIFLLTLFAEAKVVSVYSVYTLALGSLRKLQNVFTNGLEGAFGDLWARKEFEKFESNFNTFEFLIFAFVSVVFACAGILILPFVKLYTKGVTDINYLIPAFAVLSVLAYAMSCLRMPYVIAVQAAGQYKETKIGAFIEAGLNFAISLALVFRFGLVGVTVGTVVATTFRTIQYSLYMSRHMLTRSFARVVWKFLWLLLNVGCIFLLWKFLPLWEITSWYRWVMSGVIWFALSMAVTALTGVLFYRKEMKASVQVMKQMLKKRRRGKGAVA